MKLKLLLIMAMLAIPLSAVADQIADYNESAQENTTETTEISEETIEYQIHDCDAFSLEYPANWIAMDITDIANYLLKSMGQPIESSVNVAYVFMEMPPIDMIFASDEDAENVTAKSFTFGLSDAMATTPTYSISFDDTMLTPEGAPNEIIKHAVETLRIKNQTESIP